MLSTQNAAQALQRLFRRRHVAGLDELYEALGTRSRMSVFRRLTEVGYRSSYTHAGRYYTLREIPRFDEDGLWFDGELGFSQAGTLKETIARHVPVAEAGCTPAELEQLLRVRVYNPLLDLVREGRIGRGQFAGQNLYLSAEARRSAAQLARRQELERVAAETRPLSPTVTIEVLVEALQLSRVKLDPAMIAARLAARNIEVTLEQVRQTCDSHGLLVGKKTAGRASRRSRR
jgi:hypothetical protein